MTNRHHPHVEPGPPTGASERFGIGPTRRPDPQQEHAWRATTLGRAKRNSRCAFVVVVVGHVMPEQGDQPIRVERVQILPDVGRLFRPLDRPLPRPRVDLHELLVAAARAADHARLARWRSEGPDPYRAPASAPRRPTSEHLRKREYARAAGAGHPAPRRARVRMGAAAVQRRGAHHARAEARRQGRVDQQGRVGQSRARGDQAQRPGGAARCCDTTRGAAVASVGATREGSVAPGAAVLHGLRSIAAIPRSSAARRPLKPARRTSHRNLRRSLGAARCHTRARSRSPARRSRRR